MKVVIPAAGRGVRFASQGITTPKELLQLGGKPLIAHALAEAARSGFDAAVVVVSPTKQALLDYLRDNAQPLPVEVVIQPQPLGIGDAVVRCWEGTPTGVLLPDDVVLGAEHWIELAALHEQTGAATLCVRPVPPETIGRFGVAECDGDRALRLLEKPQPGETSSNLAIFGRYLVTEAVIAGLHAPPGGDELELTAGFASAVKEPLGVRVVRFTRRIFDCGTPSEYAASTSEFSEFAW